METTNDDRMCWTPIVTSFLCLLAVLTLPLWLGSCGGDEETDDDQSPAKCEAFVDLACSKFLECGAIPTADCRAAIETELDCGAVVKVAESYDRCMSDFRDMTCSVFVATDGDVPKACNDVFGVPL